MCFTLSRKVVSHQREGVLQQPQGVLTCSRGLAAEPKYTKRVVVFAGRGALHPWEASATALCAMLAISSDEINDTRYFFKVWLIQDQMVKMSLKLKNFQCLWSFVLASRTSMVVARTKYAGNSSIKTL